jgi:hypothetical protein
MHPSGDPVSISTDEWFTGKHIYQTLHQQACLKITATPEQAALSISDELSAWSDFAIQAICKHI